MKKIVLFCFVILLTGKVFAQGSYVWSCTRDTVLSCSQSCITLKALIPDLRSTTDDYGVAPISSLAGNCFRPPIPPGLGGAEPQGLNIDDRYSFEISLGFDFLFYGILYSSITVSTNGVISFDLDEAGNFAHYSMLDNGFGGLAATGSGGGVDLPDARYDRALIMGPYMDLNPTYTTSPVPINRRINYYVEGVAPNRKFILGFYRVPLFSTACENLFENTYQITLYEGTGMVDVHIFGREKCLNWNQGRAMIGMQNYDRDKGIMAPGRAASTNPLWGSANMNEGWRFTPKGGPTAFKRVELYDLLGTLIATGDTTRSGEFLEASFNNVCPTGDVTYVIKSVYADLVDPTLEIIGTDTINVFKSGSLDAITKTVTPAPCGTNPTGTITVTGPSGVNVVYSSDGVNFGSSNVFTLPPGSYTITAMDTLSGCTVTSDTTISSTTTLSATAETVNTSCPAASNGSLTINAVLGTPGYSYAVDDNTTYVAGNIFSGLTAGSHNVFVKDNAGCVFSFAQMIGSNAGFTTTASVADASCPGVANGSITVDPPTLGTAPYTYAVPGFITVPQPSNVLSGLASSTYTVDVADAVGCTYSFTQIIGNGPGITALFTSFNAACTGVSNGQIAITPSLGTAPYTFSTDTGRTFQPLDTVRNLASGNYVLVVKDALGCTFPSAEIVVGDNPGVSATFTTFNSACSGASTGQIAITTGTGIAPFSYSIDAGVTYFPLDTIRNLSSGSYSITIKDAAGCTFTSTPVVVNNGTGVSATATSFNSACAAASTGKIAITTTAGVAPFFYSLDGGVNYLPLDTIRNLAGGTYNIKVRDNLGCTFDVPAVTVNSNNPGLSATFTSINSACSGISTGQIVITPTSGLAPFSYSLNSGIVTPITDTIRNLLSGSYNIKVIDALGCNFDAAPVVVNNDAGVNATAITTNSACAVASTGQIIITTSAGTAPFAYSMDAGLTYSPLDTIRNLMGAAYNIKVRDNLGCTFDLPVVTVASNSPGLSATFSSINSACSGISTGQIVITPTSGLAPFSYSLNSGIVTPITDTIRNLLSGSYNIKVIDALGCNFDAPPVIVNNDAGVNATATTTNSACAVASTGQIIITTSAGTAPFAYSMDAGLTYSPLDTIRNLMGAAYNIKVRDNLGCTFDLPVVTVASNSPGLSATFSSINSACSGISTGQIVITPTSGLAPFSYSLNSGIVTPITDTIRNLLSGSYNIKVIDALGCNFDAAPVIVNNDAGVNAAATTRNSACAVASTGQIIITTSAGTAPFAYSMDAGLTYSPLDTIRNLMGAAYNIKVRDNLGCTFDLPVVTVASNNPGLSATFASSNAACAGVSSGSIVITPTSGLAPFTYSIDGGANFASIDTIRNLAAGVYNLKVKDALGCAFDAAPVTVSNDLGVTASFTLVKSACLGAATGAIIVKPATGTGPFSYSLNGAAPQLTDSVFRNLPSAAYNITITDAKGCVLNSPVQNLGDNPGVLTTASTIGNASCETIPNGNITVNVIAGIAPFTYDIVSVPGFPAQSSNLLSGLFADSYDILIVDSAGCSQTITSVVGNNPKVRIDSINITQPTCNGLSNGLISVNTSLGVAPYQYAIDAGNLSSNKIFSTVAAGPHILHVTDANGCQIDSAIIVAEPSVLSNNLISTQKATCSGNPDGEIVVAASGGTLPYQYTLNSSSGIGFQTGSAFAVVAGNYKVIVQDANACKAQVDVTVDSVFNMFLELGRDTTICAEASIVLSPVTNAETNLFTYTPAASLDNATIKNPSATPMTLTRYTLVARYGLCQLTDNINVDVLRKPIANAGADVVICNDTTTILRGSASNLSGTVNYSWSPAGLLDGRADSTDVIARPETALTVYTLTVTDNYGCGYTVTDDVLVNMLPPVYAFAGNDTNAVLQVPHQLTASGAGMGGTYEWSYPSQNYPAQWVNISNSFIGNPTVTFLPVTQPGTYRPDTNYYRLAVKAINVAGCSAVDTVKINVFIGPTYYCPTAFSPNGDGMNDRFTAIGVGMASTDFFRVYNRYGQVVFQTNRFMDGWDGLFRGVLQPVGAYVWVIRGKDRSGRQVDKTGTVMLLR